MNENRSTTARLLAGAIALGGTPFALFFAGSALEIGLPAGLLQFLIFSPGWFAYFALIRAAFGRRTIGDPFATWVPCILVNAFWLMMLGAETDFYEYKTFGYFYIRIYVVGAVILGVIGLVIEVNRRLHRVH
jgi:hypothetical protein